MVKAMYKHVYIGDNCIQNFHLGDITSEIKFYGDAQAKL